MVSLLRDAGLSGLVAGDAVEVVADGFEFTEGPLWCPDGSTLFQDIKAERTYRVRPDGSVEVLRERTGAANGQTFTTDGRIVFCEQNGRRVSRMALDGTGVETVVEDVGGQAAEQPQRHHQPLRRPASTSPTPPTASRPRTARCTSRGSTPSTPWARRGSWLDDFEKPNGLALSPDERTLYVCDTARYHVRAFDVEPSGALTVGSGRVFATLDPGQPGGPDGMKVDRDGRVYVAVALGVWVFEPDGRLLGILALPKRPSNLAWCDPDGTTLFITAVDAVYRVRMRVAGVVPPFLPEAG